MTDNLMTIGEFAKKYDLDYSVVYNATWLIRSKSQSLRLRLFSEHELKEAIREIAQNRIDRIEGDLKRAMTILEKTNV